MEFAPNDNMWLEIDDESEIELMKLYGYISSEDEVDVNSDEFYDYIEKLENDLLNIDKLCNDSEKEKVYIKVDHCGCVADISIEDKLDMDNIKNSIILYSI